VLRASRCPKGLVLREAEQGEEESDAPASYLHSDMSFARSRKQAGSWLLAVLLLGSAWGGLRLRVPPGGACGTAAHACCCVRSGLARCGCSGHDGAAAQLVSLAACSGELPSFLTARSPALFLLPDASSVPLQRCGVALIAVTRAPAFMAPQPVTPPPQAA
jgi:hypothetical protein